MPSIGSETYRATELPDATKETKADHAPPEVVQGEDWPTPSVPPEPVELTVEGLNPNTAPVPGPDVLVVVHGTGFTPESVIVWNGQDVVTVFETDTKLNTTISMTAVGIDGVLVRNGDKESNALGFTFFPAEDEIPDGGK